MQPLSGLGGFSERDTQGRNARPGAFQPWAEGCNPVGIEDWKTCFVYRRRFVSTRLAATLLADGARCFAFCPALVIKRDCS